MADGNFEAKVSGRRESANGIFLTLQINPADHTADLAMLRVGSSLIVGWSEVVDTTVHKLEIIPPAPESKKPRPFAELPLSQQAALRYNDNEFQFFLVDLDLNNRFKRLGWTAADEVRYRCGVESRSEFDKDYDKGLMWRGLEEQFQAWNTDRKYGSSKR